MKDGGTNQTQLLVQWTKSKNQFSPSSSIDRLKLNQFRSLGYLVLNLKMVILVTRLPQGLANYRCPYCWGKLERISLGVTRKFKFDWPAGPLQSFLANLEDHGKFCLGASLDESHAVNSMPLKLLPDTRIGLPYLYNITLEPLHHLQGKIRYERLHILA